MAKNERLIPRNCSDALLVKGYYEDDPAIKEALGKKLSDYYFKNYYGVFQVKKEDAEEIFQMSVKAILANIKMRRIYVNDEGDLIGTNNEPFTSTLTTYFMSIAENMYQELLRIHKDDTDDDPETLVSPSKEKRSGMAVPYEKYVVIKSLGAESGAWFWFVNGKSTGVKVERCKPGSKLTIQMPYIGKNLHWIIAEGDKEKDLGPVFNNWRYYDEQITQLEKIAHCLSQMTCMCKHVLTFSLFLGKSNTEIADIKGYDINTVKSKKHDCLKTLKYMVSGAHF